MRARVRRRVTARLTLTLALALTSGWVARFFDERVQRFSTWPAMLPGPSKKDCDELDESTWSVSGV